MGAVDLEGGGAARGDGVVRIVVADEDSPALRSHLREVGFDYLVRRPVHPEALRLLLLHCIYTGEERRTEPRVPVGFEVSFRTGLLPRRASLADLSSRGARLVSRWPLEPGKGITVTIPEHAGASKSISLKGRVLRVSLDESVGETPYSAAVAFDPLPAEVRQELEWVLEERARGPATLQDPNEKDSKRSPGQDPEADQAPILDPPETRGDDLLHDLAVDVEVRLEVTEDALPEAPPEGASALLGSELAPPEPAGCESGLRRDPQPSEPTAAHEQASRAGFEAPVESVEPKAMPDTTAPPHERRGGHRRTYERRIPAFGDRAMRVLVARDLSMFGMRIELERSIELSDRLHLAVYGSAEEEPFLVWATVERIAGTDGMYLRFDELHPMIADQLEQVVAGLPSVESLHDNETTAMGTVVSEILNS
jgi:hypothetical protein